MYIPLSGPINRQQHALAALCNKCGKTTPTAGELRLVLTLKGANLQDSTITPA